MQLKVIDEAGHIGAFLGLGLSFGKTSQLDVGEHEVEISKKMMPVASRLAHKDGGHNKFLESIVVWLDITAPLYWWKQFDTYRIGVTKQSESTMHTLGKKKLTQRNFQDLLPENTLNNLNQLIEEGLFTMFNNQLPQGFLQRRIVCTNYKTLRNMAAQRKNHKLTEWKFFVQVLQEELLFPEFIFKKEDNNE